jgi:putative ABC transport system substrate-binding protein
MNRRDAARALLVGPLAIGATPLVGLAQQTGKVYRIGYLSTPTRDSVGRGVDAFVRKLRELGWIEGQNLTIEYRWAEGNVERLPELAADLVQRKVDLIVAPAGSAALAAKKATSTIPIVMIFAIDPVDAGLVASLNRPGGNVTGTTFTPSVKLYGKQVEILKEALPHVSRIAYLRNPVDTNAQASQEVETAARDLHVRLQYVDARNAEELDGAFAAIARERSDALLISPSSTFIAQRTRVGDLALKARLPAMSNIREMVEAGILMAYGVNMADFVGRAATYVDKILRGAKPADLPVEQPAKFELAINLRTARAIGLALPQSLLLRADEVIQ